MLNHFELVGEFHKTFDHPIRTEYYTNCFDDLKLMNFRYKLMKEEYDEFVDACKKNDRNEIIDGLCDLAYVIYGAGHCFGINLSCYCNVFTGKSNLEDFLKKIKGDYMENAISDLDIFLNSYLESINEHNHQLLQNSLMVLLDTTYKIVEYLNVDMDKMFREVHRANMTKACSTEEQAIQTCLDYKNKNIDAGYKKYNDKYILYNKADTKILKNLSWEEPSFVFD